MAEDFRKIILETYIYKKKEKKKEYECIDWSSLHRHIQCVGAALVVMQTHLFVLLQICHSQPTTGRMAQKRHF